MNDTNTANAYLRTRVMTASREELRLLLIDGAIKFAQQAMTGMENKNPELTYSGFSQCRDIVLELLNSIKPEYAPEIAKSVQDLYTYMYGELVKASINKDKAILAEVISLLEYERETWVLTMNRVIEDREHAPSSTGTPGTVQAQEKPSSISFQA
ncbi:MAG: flagellar export chaperone FliS [Phycisphaerae bacterium]|nr:flagellar export chaperone FliS [Phycisphaerae bacterium]